MFFFFNDTATTEIYTLSLHDALPIYWEAVYAEYALNYQLTETLKSGQVMPLKAAGGRSEASWQIDCGTRSEEHTSELQSRQYLVCRLLLEKKKKAHRARLFLQ